MQAMNAGTPFACVRRPGLLRALLVAVFPAACFWQFDDNLAARAQVRQEKQESKAAGADVAGWPERWQRNVIRHAVDRLAAQQQVAIFVDRRVNPDALVTGDFPSASLSDLLEATGLDHGFSITVVETVIYLGPEQAVRRLRTIDRLRLAEDRRLNTPSSRGLVARSALQWPDLASPRDLVLQVCREARISITNEEQIPHDLWAAGRLPNLPRGTQLTILLAGFDLTFDLDEHSRLTLRRVRDDELWQQEYRVPAGRSLRIHELRQHLPEARLELSPGRLGVTAQVEEHEAVQRWLQSGSRQAWQPDGNQPAGGGRIYSLRVVRKPLREVLRALESPLQPGPTGE